jgi:hypothetical protein
VRVDRDALGDVLALQGPARRQVSPEEVVAVTVRDHPTRTMAQDMTDGFHPGRMSRHAIREARRERISTTMIARAYDDPDATRRSDHDDLREIRSRWFGEEGIEVVVDTDDLRVVTVWRRGAR